MANVKLKQQHIKFIDHKLEFLEHQRTNLHHVVDSHVEKIVKLARTWADESHEEEVNFTSLSQFIDNAVTLLSQKAIDIEQEAVDTSPQALHLEASTREDSTDADLASSSTSSSVPAAHDESQVSVSDQDEEKFHQVFNRLEQLEKTVVALEESCMKVHELENSVDTISAKWKKKDKSIEHILMEQRKTEEKVETILVKQNETSEQLNSIAKTQTSAGKKGKQLSTKLDEVTDRMVNMSSEIGELGNRVEEVYTQQQSVGENIEQLETDIHDMSEKMEGIFKKHHEMESVVKETSAISSKVDSQHQDVSSNLLHYDEKIGKLADKLGETENKLETIGAKHSETERKIGDISRLVSTASMDEGKTSDLSLVEVLLKLRQEDLEKMRQFHRKIMNVKQKSKIQMQQVDDKYEKVEFQYKMVCQIVADRLLALERLRDILNKKIECRNENIKKLRYLDQEVAAMSADVKRLSSSAGTKPRVGFTAYLPQTYHVKFGATLKRFANVLCNVGGHFNPFTGEFVAPVDGMYVVNLTLWQWEEGGCDIEVIHKVSKGVKGSTVCLAATGNDQTSGTALGVVEMRAGEKLFALVNLQNGYPSLSYGTSFSCFLV